MNNWHSDYIKKTKTMSNDSLVYVMKDARDAADAGQEIGNPKVGQYLDEIHYCAMELRRRSV